MIETDIHGVTDEQMLEAAKEMVARETNGGDWVRRGKIPDAIEVIIKAYRLEKQVLRVSIVENVVKSWALRRVVAGIWTSPKKIKRVRIKE